MAFEDVFGANLDFKRVTSYAENPFSQISDISYSDFFWNFLIPNRPCIFRQNVTEHWPCRRLWVRNNRPDFNYLEEKFGEAVVPVADCNVEEYSSHPKEDMTLREYLHYWQRYREGGYNSQERCLYLKDWHFTKAFPNYLAYQTPVYFQSDWLNEYWDSSDRDDYRFVYMGPKGTWTPFHADVYRSFSWSANICGRKRWLFYPPGCEESLKDRFGRLVYDVTSPDLDDPIKYPNAHKVKGKQLEVIQEQGQIIFVPSGWHHQVFNMEDTISINHNWLNGCNIDLCWHHIQDCLKEVKHEIHDCRDMEGWEDQCQLILNASAGIDYKTFLCLLKHITERRIVQFREKRESMSKEGRDPAVSEGSISDKYNGIRDVWSTSYGGEGDKLCDKCDDKLCDKYDKLCDKYDDKFSDTLKDKSKDKTDKISEYREGMEKKTDEDIRQDSAAVSDKDSEPVNIEFGTDVSHKSAVEFKSKLEVSDTVACVDTEGHKGLQYIRYDLLRLKAALKEVSDDQDYKLLNIEDSESAENLLMVVDKLPFY